MRAAAYAARPSCVFISESHCAVWKVRGAKSERCAAHGSLGPPAPTCCAARRPDDSIARAIDAGVNVQAGRLRACFGGVLAPAGPTRAKPAVCGPWGPCKRSRRVQIRIRAALPPACTQPGGAPAFPPPWRARVPAHCTGEKRLGHRMDRWERERERDERTSLRAQTEPLLLLHCSRLGAAPRPTLQLPWNRIPGAGEGVRSVAGAPVCSSQLGGAHSWPGCYTTSDAAAHGNA